MLLPLKKLRVGCLGTTDETANFKDEDSQEEDMLHGEVFECLPPYRLRGCQWKEHGRAIPTNILKAVKLVGDGRDGGSDDGLEWLGR